MYKRLVLVLSLLFAASAGANYDENEQFEEYPYIGVGYSALSGDYDLNAIGLDTYSFNNGLVGIIGGYRFHPNLAGEVRGYGNASEDEILGVVVEVENSFSVLGKALVPIGRYIDIYGILGFGTSKAEASYNGLSVSKSDEDIQYGVGFAVNKGEALELHVEWMRLYDSGGLEVDGFNINLVYRML